MNWLQNCTDTGEKTWVRLPKFCRLTILDLDPSDPGPAPKWVQGVAFRAFRAFWVRFGFSAFGQPFFYCRRWCWVAWKMSCFRSSRPPILQRSWTICPSSRQKPWQNDAKNDDITVMGLFLRFVGSRIRSSEATFLSSPPGLGEDEGDESWDCSAGGWSREDGGPASVDHSGQDQNGS